MAQRGFALPLVLVMLATATSLAVIAMRNGQQQRGLVAAEIARTQERLALKSAIDLVLPAMRSADHPFHRALLSNGPPLGLTLDRLRISVRLERESGKIDLNAAPPDLVAAGLQELDEATASEMLARVEERRSGQRVFLSEAVVLPPSLRFGRLRERAAAIFTIMTGSAGVDPAHAALPARRALARLSRSAAIDADAEPSAIELLRNRELAPYIATEAPIYTLRASLDGGRRSYGLSFRLRGETGEIRTLRAQFSGQ